MAEWTPLELRDPETGKRNQYRYRLDWNACELIQDALGTSEEEFLNIKITAKDLKVWLWAGLQQYHPNLTRQDVGRMVHISDTMRILDIMNQEVGKMQVEGEDSVDPTTNATWSGSVPPDPPASRSGTPVSKPYSSDFAPGNSGD